ncbi:uncharacterized protein LOC110734953 [Chenopodium quinoa]|uniref:uncharacterized protein LOC110734953 n=1 Tax=Chenopodium quinoa TaxID=63459 RepID=UPI000B76E3CF|nr:uncharacterized protein LOC110734953 [Chenopodium quinoa]
MNRDWMYVENRTQPEFLNGIEEFCRTAIEHQRTTKGETIFCPYRDCNNVKKWKEISVVENHLFRRGFMANYTIWYWHGEKIIPTTSRSSINDADMENREQHDDNEKDTDENFEEDRIPEIMDGFGDHVNEKSRMFENVSKAAETPLYPGCAKYSKLSGVLTLFNLKAKNGWTDKSFNSLLEALSDMLPEGNDIPKSTYYAKKLLCPLGLEYTKIDAFPNDCCGIDRYKRKGSNPNRKKWPPAKVLWYLPIIPRFKRLFSIKKDAKNLVWHAQERKKDGYIRHPADSKQWKHIDDTFPEFGKEVRNLRFALSTDGMNPYGTLMAGAFVDL